MQNDPEKLLRSLGTSNLKFKILFFTIIFCGVFGLVKSSWAADHYVRSGASGTNNGTDWTNAWTTLPAVLVRGDTYYIADGSYGGYTFDDAEAGTDLITIKKAITASHGTEAGWNNSYGDETAEFTSALSFDTDYWFLDGQVGSGKSGHGFRVTTTACTSDSKLITINNGADYITVSHTEMEHCGMNLDYNQDCFYAVSSSDGGSSHITVSYSYLHDVSRVMMLLNNFTESSIEHCYFEKRRHTTIHGEAISMNFCGLNANNSLKYNIFENIYGTGIVVIKDAIQSHFYIHGNLFFSTDPESSYYETHNGAIANTSGDTNTYMYVYNNTFVDLNDVTGINWYNGSNNYSANNIWVNSDTINAIGTNESNNTKNGATSLFGDYASDDFTLSSALEGDSAIGATFNTDMFGNVRGADGVWDRGAYEYIEESALQADFDSDSDVDIFDYNILLANFGTTGDCQNPADTDADCDVDIFDYSILLGEFGAS